VHAAWSANEKESDMTDQTTKPAPAEGDEVRDAAQALIDHLWKTQLAGIPFHLVADLKQALDAQPQPKGAAVAWRDPSNVEPGQGCTYDKSVADKWPHIYRQPLYAESAQAPAPTLRRRCTSCAAPASRSTPSASRPAATRCTR
jgi:hypothetical protein